MKLIEQPITAMLQSAQLVPLASALLKNGEKGTGEMSINDVPIAIDFKPAFKTKCLKQIVYFVAKLTSALPTTESKSLWPGKSQVIRRNPVTSD